MLETIKIGFKAATEDFEIMLDADSEERAKTVLDFYANESGYSVEDATVTAMDYPGEFQYDAVTDKDYSNKFNRYATDEKLKEDYERSCDGNCYIIDGYSGAAIGISQDGRIVYDFDKIIDIMRERDGMATEEAVEFYEYNIVRSFPYFRPSPIIMRHN